MDLKVERSNVEQLTGTVNTCDGKIKTQNETIVALEAAGVAAKLEIEKATTQANTTRVQYEKKIRDILARPVAQTCELAIQELKESAKEDSIW